jgi:hypothetical protein
MKYIILLNNKSTILYFLASFFILYTFKLRYAIVLLPLLVVFIIFKTKKLFVNKSLLKYYIFIFYIIVSLFISLFLNNFYLLLMDVKVLFFVFIFYFGYLLSNKISLHNFLRAYMIFSLFFPLISIYIFYNYDVLLWGNRGDLGSFIVLINVVNIYSFIRKEYSLKIFIYLIFINLGALQILHGRTALLAYLSLFILYFIYRKSFSLRIKAKFIIPLLGIIFMVGYVSYSVFVDRITGGSSTLENEARYLSSFLFLNILEKSDFVNLLFGYGYGAHYEMFAENMAFIQAHVRQIMSSAGGYYVSWGFHNAVYRNIVMFGIVGSFLFYSWQISTFKNYSKKKVPYELSQVLKIFFIITLLVSFSNGIYGITLVSSFIFFTQGFLLRKILMKDVF